MKSTVCCLVKSLEHSTLVLHYQVLSLLSPSKKLKQNGFNTMHALGQIILCLLHDRMTARMITQLKNNDPSNQFLMVLRIKIFFPLIDIPKLFHQRESSIYYRNKKKKMKIHTVRSQTVIVCASPPTIKVEPSLNNLHERM